MKDKTVVCTTLRFNLLSREDQTAWNELQKLHKKEHQSYSRLLIEAIHGLFQEKMTPKQTREQQERAITQQIIDAITRSMNVSNAYLVVENKPDQPSEEDLSNAIDFMDSL